jgi:hypothetical protein
MGSHITTVMGAPQIGQFAEFSPASAGLYLDAEIFIELKTPNRCYQKATALFGLLMWQLEAEKLLW